MENVTDIRKQLSMPRSCKGIDSIVDYVSNHPQDFIPLLQLTQDNEPKIAWRATWVCVKLCKKEPRWFIPYYKQLIEDLSVSTHDGIKRSLLSILYQLPVTGEFPVTLFNYCINRMLSPEESIAVQAHCMKLAYKLCLQERELLCELKVYLENVEPEYYSTGVQCTRRNILRKIDSQHKKEKQNYVIF